MAENKTTEILEFKVDQGAAITELERTRKAMIALKEEQGELQKAYKKGDITLEEYAKELTRVDLVQKRLSSNHNDLQKKVTGTSSAFDKFTKSLQSSTQNLTIAGTNVGALGGAVTKLMTPVGLAIGLVGTLGAAYAKSAAGSKDLAFASNQLGAAVQILSNNFANLLTSSEDGQGSLSIFVDKFFRHLTLLSGGNTRLADQSRAMALVIEQMDDLTREQIRVQGVVKTRLGENADLMEDINDSHTSVNDRAAKFLTIENNILLNSQEQKKVLQDQFDLLVSQRGKVSDIDKLETLILTKETEMKALDYEKERALSRIGKQRSNIADSAKKEADSQAKILSDLEREARIAKFNRELPKKEQAALEVKIESDAAQSMFSVRRHLAEQTKKLQKESTEEFLKNQKAKEISRQTEIQALQLFFNESSRLGGIAESEGKGFALAQLGIDTAITLSSLIRNSEANPLNIPTGGIAGSLQFASGLVRIAANIGQAYRILGTGSPGLGGIATETFSVKGQQYGVVNGDLVKLNSKGKVPVIRRIGNKIVDTLSGAFDGEPGFADSGVVSEGLPINRENGDNRLVTAKVGEVYLNKHHQAMLGGARTFRAIGVPGFAGSGIVRPMGGMLTAADVINIVSAMPPNALVYKEFRNFERGVLMKEQSTTR